MPSTNYYTTPPPDDLKIGVQLASYIENAKEDEFDIFGSENFGLTVWNIFGKHFPQIWQ